MALPALLPPLLLLLLLVVLYKYGTRTHGTLERLGIPVIPPYPFLGSTPRPWSIYAAEEDMKNARRFGGVWGQYEGMTPQVFIANVDTAKRIMIKDFDHFVDRPTLFDIDLARDMLDLLKGERWKVVRSVLSPTLSSATKLKAMVPKLEECLGAACDRLDAKLADDPVVLVKNKLMSPVVLDVMAQFAFGLKIPGLDDPDNPFVRAVAAISQEEIPSGSVLVNMMIYSPVLMNFVMNWMFKPHLRYFVDVVRQSVKQRRADGIDRPDLIGVLIDAIDNKVPTSEFRALNITEDLLLIQGAEMLMASYDTTGTTLTTAAFHLVSHPDVMSRVVEEVNSVDELTYESLHELPLLEAVIQETLRVSSIVARHFRLCVRDWEGDGFRIPAGTNVMIPVWPFHFNEEVFEDADKFLPDRWLGEQGLKLGQYSWMPFGLGPRACVGTRLGMVSVKFVLAYLLRRYRLSATDKTQLVYKKGLVFSFPVAFEPIYIKMEKLE